MSLEQSHFAPNGDNTNKKWWKKSTFKYNPHNYSLLLKNANQEGSITTQNTFMLEKRDNNFILHHSSFSIPLKIPGLDKLSFSAKEDKPILLTSTYLHNSTGPFTPMPIDLTNNELFEKIIQMCTDYEQYKYVVPDIFIVDITNDGTINKFKNFHKNITTDTRFIGSARDKDGHLSNFEIELQIFDNNKIIKFTLDFHISHLEEIAEDNWTGESPNTQFLEENLESFKKSIGENFSFFLENYGIKYQELKEIDKNNFNDYGYSLIGGQKPKQTAPSALAPHVANFKPPKQTLSCKESSSSEEQDTDISDLAMAARLRKNFAQKK